MFGLKRKKLKEEKYGFEIEEKDNEMKRKYGFDLLSLIFTGIYLSMRERERESNGRRESRETGERESQIKRVS